MTHKRPRLMIVAEFDPSFRPHAATTDAIAHSAGHLGVDIQVQWTSTMDVTPGTLADCDGIWIAPGSPYKSMDRALDAIRYAREHDVPCFGTCGGCQHMIIEYARNVLGIADAQHAEYDPYASNLFISSLTCSLAGRAMRLEFAAGSRVAGIYGRTTATEEYYCNFGVNPDVIPLLKRGKLRIVGSDAEGEVRVLELPDHPFFVATLFVPQTRSRAEAPHPLIDAFLRAIQRAARGQGAISHRTRALSSMEHFSHADALVPKAYGPYSHSIVAGDFVFLAGQTGRDSVSGKIIDGDVAAQTSRSLEIIRDILREHELTLSDVVRATVYLARMEDFDAMNAVYGATFRAPYPVRSTVEVRMAFGALVGIEVTAFRRRRFGVSAHS